MAICMKADTKTCSLATCDTRNSADRLLSRNQSRKFLFSNRSIVVHTIGKISRCASSKTPGFSEGVATDVLLRQVSAFCVVSVTSFTLDCVAPPKNAQRWQICGRSTERIYSSLKHHSRIRRVISESSALLVALPQEACVRDELVVDDWFTMEEIVV